MSVLSFSEGYRQYFEVIPAVTENLRQENYRLRHEVYCRDLGFEATTKDGRESDSYDRHSLHCLVRALGSGAFVGCARIVLADPANPSNPLPFETACGTSLDWQLVNSRLRDRSKIAEISRLAILGRYRRRKGESDQPFALETLPQEGAQLRLPYLPVALYLALLALAYRQGVETLFVLTEPRLASSVNRLGGALIPVGRSIQHRGTRIPSMMDVQNTVGAMNPYVRSFFNLITDEIEAFLNLPTDQVTPPANGITEFLRRA